MKSRSAFRDISLRRNQVERTNSVELKTVANKALRRPPVRAPKTARFTGKTQMMFTRLPLPCADPGSPAPVFHNAGVFIRPRHTPVKAIAAQIHVMAAMVLIAK